MNIRWLAWEAERGKEHPLKLWEGICYTCKRIVRLSDVRRVLVRPGCCYGTPSVLASLDFSAVRCAWESPTDISYNIFIDQSTNDWTCLFVVVEQECFLFLFYSTWKCEHPYLPRCHRMIFIAWCVLAQPGPLSDLAASCVAAIRFVHYNER